MISPASTFISSDVSSAVPEKKMAVPNTSDQTAASALAAARKLLHHTDCDPREANLFRGINISLIGDADMARLRDLLCGALSVRDRRPWSSNGKRISVCNSTTFRGTCFNFLNVADA